MSRLNAVCRAYLMWQFEHNAEHPYLEKFLESGPQIVEGQEVTKMELELAVRRAQHHELIGGGKGLGPSVFTSPTLVYLCRRVRG